MITISRMQFLPNYPVRASPAPLSNENSYTVWPGGAFPRSQLIPTSGGSRKTPMYRKKKTSKKSSKKQSRKHSRKHSRKTKTHKRR